MLGVHGASLIPGRRGFFMPAPVIPSPVLIIATLCEGPANEIWQNIFYYAPTTDPATSSDVSAMVSSFNGIFSPLLVACMQMDTSFLGANGTFKNGVTLLQGSSGTGANPGSLAGTSVSDQNAVCIRKHTGTGGRQNRGRWFIGGMDSSAFSPADPDELTLLVITPLYQALAAALSADQTLNGIVCHARHWDRKDNLLKPIVECRVSTRIASRDSRRKHQANLGL
jgi:hypothetical protein